MKSIGVGPFIQLKTAEVWTDTDYGLAGTSTRHPRSSRKQNMRKQLYYLTTDEANASMAEPLVFAEGIHLEPADPRDLPRLRRKAAAVVLDWDHVPPETRAHLLNGFAGHLVGLHGYQISDSVAGFLPQRGIVVSRRLDQAFVAALAGPARAA
jgi:hypothetical protein